MRIAEICKAYWKNISLPKYRDYVVLDVPSPKDSPPFATTTTPVAGTTTAETPAASPVTTETPVTGTSTPEIKAA